MSKPHPRNGWSVRELAEKTGASPRAIISWTSEPRADYLARANEKRARVQELRAKGLSMRAIAAEIGCSVGTVHRYVKEAEENNRLDSSAASRRSPRKPSGSAVERRKPPLG